MKTDLHKLRETQGTKNTHEKQEEENNTTKKQHTIFTHWKLRARPQRTYTRSHAHAHAHASFISTTTKPLPDSATNTDGNFNMHENKQAKNRKKNTTVKSCSMRPLEKVFLYQQSEVSEPQLLRQTLRVSDSAAEGVCWWFIQSWWWPGWRLSCPRRGRQ